MSEKGYTYIGLKNKSPRYEQMIHRMQIRYAPITKTDAVKKLLDAGAKSLLKGETFPPDESAKG